MTARRLLVKLLFTAVCLYGYDLRAGNPKLFVELKSGGDIESLDPSWAFDTTSDEAIMNIYEPLIFYKGASIKELEPMLATKVPSVTNGLISADGKTYTFPIRQGVKFHDGALLTCEDARYSILRFMITDRSAGPSSLLLEPIAGTPRTRDPEGKTVLDFANLERRVTCHGNGLVITLPKPYGPFLSIMAQWSYVLPKAWAMSHGEWDGTAATWMKHNNTLKETSYLFDHTNGTGPFELERWDKSVKQITLKRFAAYWRTPARLERVVIKGIAEFNTRKLLITSGDADLLDETQGRQFEAQLMNIPKVKALDFAYLRNEAFFFVYDLDPVANAAIFSGKLDGEGIPTDFFKDADVRRGFAYAFDYDAYIKEVLKSKAYYVRGCIPKGMLGYAPGLAPYALDFKKAETHFRKAWGGKVWEKGFKLAIYHDTANIMRQMACEILKKNLERINPKFKVEVRSLIWSTYLANARNFKMPVFQLGWTADFADPHNFAFAYLHSEGNYPKRQRLVNPAWDKLVDQANAETDPAKRETLY
ncbi:MAG: ABC transporter substrate-binding protein, partial [Elusimicrobiota bacterium]